MEANCAICETEIEVQMCCNGSDCGCQGLPVDPPVCSDECYDKYMEYRNKLKTGEVKIPKVITDFSKKH